MTLTVAPFTGAWIEIDLGHYVAYRLKVAPFTGAWIEIKSDLDKKVAMARSLPSRGRGLKFQLDLLPQSYQTSLPSRGRGLK